MKDCKDSVELVGCLHAVFCPFPSSSTNGSSFTSSQESSSKEKQRKNVPVLACPSKKMLFSFAEDSCELVKLKAFVLEEGKGLLSSPSVTYQGPENETAMRFNMSEQPGS